MKYIYIFYFGLGHIYEITIDKEKFNKIDNIEKYLYKNYHLKSSEINYMISNKKLEIESI